MLLSPKNEKNRKTKLSPIVKDHMIKEQMRLLDHAKQASMHRMNTRRHTIANQIGVSLHENSSKEIVANNNHQPSTFALLNKTQTFSMKRNTHIQAEANQMLMSGKPT